MSDSNVQPLEQISSEVVESQFKIILSSQCIKAQAFLVEKLRKQAEQTKQICTFINNGNYKLENEIKLGELEIKSLLSALETIKSANVELKKELLLSEEEKKDLTERVDSGIKKYEALWIASKKRYDNIPLIKEKQQIENKGIILDKSINSLDLEIQNLVKALDTRKNELINLDKKNIINIAEYMIHERPKLIQYVNEKKEETVNLMREISELQYEQEDNNRNPLQVIDITMNESPCGMENTCSNITKNNDNEINETVLLPKLQLQNIDLDFLTDKLIQIRKADPDSSLIEKVDSESKIRKNDLENNNILVSSNLKTSINEDKNKDIYQSINYSEKKLIHILEDIQLHKKETFNIFSKLNPNEFYDVNTIRADLDLNKTQQSQEKIDCLVEVDQNEIIEEVDLTIKDSSDIVVPPTQFLDLSQGDLLKSSQKCDEGPMEVIDTPEEHCSITKEKQVQNSSVAGFLFTHGSKGLPELLDMSMASTCIDESDEFPHCIDSTLLLSPKADEVMSASGDKNAKELSQEVPNFLSGFRKVGLSFFGNSSSEKKSDPNNKNLNTDFNFNFGSTEKKSRGGLFSMFN